MLPTQRLAPNHLVGGIPTNWLRLYTKILDNEDLYALPVAARWTWIELLAAISERDGVPISARSFAFRIRSRLSTLKLNIDRLVGAGMVVQENGKLIPRNWAKFQYKSDDSAARMRRHRERTGDVTRSPPEQSRTEAEQNTESSDHSDPRTPPQAASATDFYDAEGPARMVAALVDIAKANGRKVRGGRVAALVKRHGENKTRLLTAFMEAIARNVAVIEDYVEGTLRNGQGMEAQEHEVSPSGEYQDGRRDRRGAEVASGVTSSVTEAEVEAVLAARARDGAKAAPEGGGAVPEGRDAGDRVQQPRPGDG